MAKIDELLGSSAEIDAGMMEIAGEFFDVSEDTLKTGLFGWNRTAMADAIKKSIFSRNLIHGEFAINTASLPSTIYSRAVDYQVDITRSTPASCKVSVALPYAEIQSRMVNSVFKIDREDFSILMESIPFMLPYSLFIEEDTSTSVINVTYNVTNERSIIDSDHKSFPFARYTTATFNGESYLIIECDFYQMELNTYEFEVLTNNLSERIFFTFPVEDQLVNFAVDYYVGGSTTSTELPVYLNTKTNEEDEDYALYTFSTDNQIQLFFPSASGEFQPSFNSILEVPVYTSLGVSGNFTYTGSIGFSLNDTDSTLSDITPVMQLLSNPSGGSDQSTVKELKTKLFAEIKKTSALATLDDLNSHLNQAGSAVIANNNKVSFIKSRDDVIKREYLAYMQLADEGGTPLQTNTVDITTSMTELALNGYSLNYGSLVVYEPQTQSYRLVRADEFPEDLINDSNSFVYAMPFTLRMKTEPFIRMAVYDNNVNIKSSLKYQRIESVTSSNFILNSVELTRKVISENYYTLTCNMSISDNDNDISVDTLKVVAVIKGAKSNVPIGYIELAYEDTGDTGNTFVGLLNTDDNFTIDDTIEIVNSIKNIRTSSYFSITELPDEISVNIAVFQESSITNRSISIATNDEDLTALDIPEYRTSLYHVTAVTESNLNLFTSNSDLLSIDPVIKSDSVVLESVPLIGANTFFNETKYTTFSNQYKSLATYIRSAFDKIRNNTSINLKFFNTYGVSQHLNIGSTNIRLEFKIKLHTSYNKTLDTNIRAHIASFIYSVEDNFLSISRLMDSIHGAFSSVKSITFVSLNDLAVQEVYSIYGASELEERYATAPPELITLNFRQASGLDLIEQDITITYV